MILLEQMNQAYACDIVLVGEEGREREQMLLKREDLTRKKKQNFLLLRSTYSFLCFIQKIFQECPAWIYMAQEKVCTGDFHVLTLLKEKINKKTTKIPGDKEQNRIHSFSTNT